MAFNKINIVEKYTGTPLEIVAVSSRLATPYLIQPTYVMDVSILKGIFIPCASTGVGLVWNSVTHLLDVSIVGVSRLDKLLDVSINTSLIDNQFLVYDATLGKWANKIGLDTSLYNVVDISSYNYNIRNYFYTKTEIDGLLDAVVGGTY